MTKLSDSTAVRVARNTLAAYDTVLHPAADDRYWLGMIREALRLLLAEIDAEEGGTP